MFASRKVGEACLHKDHWLGEERSVRHSLQKRALQVQYIGLSNQEGVTSLYREGLLSSFRVMMDCHNLLT
jgi:hypothetical protein